jgi:hypothetical protein
MRQIFRHRSKAGRAGPLDGTALPRDLGGRSPAEAAVNPRLAAAGLLAPPPDDTDLPTDPEAIEALEREHEAWLATLAEPLGLAEAVLDDRR